MRTYNCSILVCVVLHHSRSIDLLCSYMYTKIDVVG